MPPTGSTFTDWQQVEKESRLLMNEDFSWSEPPQRRRRRITEEPIRARRRAPVREHEPERYEPDQREPERYEPDQYEPERYEPEPSPVRELSRYDGADGLVAHVRLDQVDAWDQPTAAHSHFDEMMEQWNASYGDPADRAFDLSDPGVPGVSHRQDASQGGRRTVVITGRGDDRYMPAPRRTRSTELRFHERSTFSPDRGAFWALLLGLALFIGAIAH